MAGNPRQVISVNELHRALDIPYKYLGRLMPRLAEAGMVQALKGKNGGYRLVEPLDKVRTGQVIEVVEGWGEYNQCILGFQECSSRNPCPIHNYWAPIKSQIVDMFHNLTLKDLADHNGASDRR